MTSGAARLRAVAAAVLFSTGGAGIKVEAFSALQVSALRSGFATVALIAWLRGGVVWSWPAAGAGVIYAGMLTLFVTSTKLTTAANAIFLQSTAPLYLLVLAPLVLRERFQSRDLGYLCALAAGLILCVAGRVTPTDTAINPALGDILGVASGFVWALTLLSLRYVARTDPSGRATITAVVAGNALASAGALPVALPLPAASGAEWATVAYLGVFQIGLGYVFLSSAARRLPAFELSLLLLIEPVLNPIWTWLVHGEDPGGWTIAGGAVIIAATAVRILYDARCPADHEAHDDRLGKTDTKAV